MNIELQPEDEQLIHERIQHGGFASAQEVVHHALQVQAAEEEWLALHRREVEEKIDRAIAEFDRGAGVPDSQVPQHLAKLKDAHRVPRK